MLYACVSSENAGLNTNVLIYELKHNENIFTSFWIDLMDFPVLSMEYRLSKQNNVQIEYSKI